MHGTLKFFFFSFFIFFILPPFHQFRIFHCLTNPPVFPFEVYPFHIYPFLGRSIRMRTSHQAVFRVLVRNVMALLSQYFAIALLQVYNQRNLRVLTANNLLCVIHASSHNRVQTTHHYIYHFLGEIWSWCWWILSRLTAQAPTNLILKMIPKVPEVCV